MCRDPEIWGVEVQNTNLIRRSGFAECAFLCFNLLICLLLNIPLYLTNQIGKNDGNCLLGQSRLTRLTDRALIGKIFRQSTCESALM